MINLILFVLFVVLVCASMFVYRDIIKIVKDERVFEKQRKLRLKYLGRLITIVCKECGKKAAVSGEYFVTEQPLFSICCGKMTYEDK